MVVSGGLTYTMLVARRPELSKDECRQNHDRNAVQRWLSAHMGELRPCRCVADSTLPTATMRHGEHRWKWPLTVLNA